MLINCFDSGIYEGKLADKDFIDSTRRSLCSMVFGVKLEFLRPVFAHRYKISALKATQSNKIIVDLRL